MNKREYPRTYIRKVAARMFWLSRKPNSSAYGEALALGNFHAYQDVDRTLYREPKLDL